VIRRTGLLAAVLAIAALVSGCGFSGLNDRPLPFAAGNGKGALTVKVVMESAANLVPNSEVKVGDVTVGSVRRITFHNWQAVLEVGLDKGTTLPANATATIGQKSLLGAEYLELAAPTGTPATGRLQDGATIPISRTGRYPETEEVFAALSTVLNGGGLAQVQTITTELNHTLHGREGDVRDLLGQLTTFAGTLDAQRHNILSALDQLNRTTRLMRGQTPTIDHALTALPKAVDVLEANRTNLTTLLSRMQDFSTVATHLETATRSDLEANLANLKPVLSKLADAGKALTGFLGDATFPFPTDGLLKSVKGDYMNLFLTVDLSLTSLGRDWLTGTPLDGLYSSLTGGLLSGTSSQSTNPLDLNGLLGSATQLLKRQQTASTSPAPKKKAATSTKGGS